MPNSYPIPGHILFTKLPNSVTQEKLLNLLPQELVEKIGRVHLFKEEHSAVIEVLDYEMVDELAWKQDFSPFHHDCGQTKRNFESITSINIEEDIQELNISH